MNKSKTKIFQKDAFYTCIPDSNYALQTIKDNIVLLAPHILDEINQIAVKAGHSIIATKQELRGSCEEFKGSNIQHQIMNLKRKPEIN